MSTRGFERATRKSNLILKTATRKNFVSTRKNELVTRCLNCLYYQLVTRRTQLVTHNSQLVTRVLSYHKRTYNENFRKNPNDVRITTETFGKC